MPQLDAATVAQRLGLGDDHRAWLKELEAAGASVPPPALPRSDDLALLFERLGISRVDAADLTKAWPSPDRTPEVWWLLERCHRCIVADLGSIEDPAPWPSLPRSLGMLGRFFYVYAFLAAVPDVRRWHRQHHITDEISWATLADLGRHLAIDRRINGEGGLDRPFWLRAHFRGALYQLGRLQFCRSRIPSEPAMLEGLGVPFRHGDLALDVHIPEHGPLTPAACDRSLRWACDFFPVHFSAERYQVAICTSWLLDDQLASYLEPDSNIIRFQRRFSLLPDGGDGDKDMLMFVFRRAPASLSAASLNELPQRTSLERAVVAHLEGGHHWKVRTGWLEL
jgi:GNAT domain-containint protein/N-acyltransferase family protein